MSQLEDLIKKMRSTYELFLNEYSTHAVVFCEVEQEISKTEDAAAINEIFQNSSKRLESRYHVLRGGAGFLRLDEVARLATEAEQWFKSKTYLESSTEFKERFLTLNKDLSLAIEDLRRMLENP